MFPHFVFFISYFFYAWYFYINHNKFIYPVILLAFFVYIFFFVFAYLDIILIKDKFKNIFNKYSKFLYVFLLFFITPLFIKVNIPEPHNFMLRKFEIIPGAVFSTFVSLCAINFAVSLYRNKENLIEIIKSFWLITIFFYIFYSGVSLWFNYANQPTGDEPEYLLMAHSIVYDRDLDLKNNFDNKDYRNFYLHKDLLPQDASIKKEGKLFSYHPFFYSLIISPFYFLGKRLGVTLLMNFFSALIIGMIFLIIYNLYKRTDIALIISYIAGFSLPILLHVNHVATDITSALIFLFVFYILYFSEKRYFLFSFLAIFAIWLHIRNIPLILIFILLYIFYNRHNKKSVILVLFFNIINFILLLIVNKLIYGVYLPKQADTAGNFLAGFNFKILNGLTGILFDQEFGLFFYSPIFILFLAGFYILFKTNKKLFIDLLFILLPYLIFISAWGEWRGGGGASARFLIPVIICFILPIASIYIYIQNKPITILFRILCIWGFFMSYLMILIPWFRWNKGQGTNWFFQIILSIFNFDFSVLFPSIWHYRNHTTITLVFWATVILLINIWLIRKIKIY